MPTLAVLAFATPIFGFALTPPGPVLSSPPNAVLHAPVFAQIDDDDDRGRRRRRSRARARDREENEEAQASDSDSEDESDSVDESDSIDESDSRDESDSSDDREEESSSSSSSSARSEGGGAQDMQAYAAQLRQRQQLGTIHRAFGIATWASMLVTVALGFIQYYNLYGFFGSREDTPCVQGGAVFGQDQCWGTPWPHRISAFATTALYSTSFILSFVLPDPDHADQGTSSYANNLRIHKALRWVHLAGMVLQVFLGLASANDWFGTDRANDFGAQQALATVHNVIGLTTFGVMTAAGAIMLF